jgi:hypothetical protein
MRRLLSAFFVLLAPLSASAAFHLWDITEVYSNADGTVQFVEMEDCGTLSCNNENLMTGHTLSSGSETYTVTSDLPSGTAGHKLLFATPAFASQPGAVTPDYVLSPLTPAGTQFMSLAADTLNWAGVDTFSYNTGELPTNGTDSLNEPFGSNVRTTAANSPTNFAGQVGHLPEPSAPLALIAGIACLVGLMGTRRS